MEYYLISDNVTILELINSKINNFMKNNLVGYNAVKWGSIVKHPVENKYALEIKTDNRNPLERLSTLESNKLITSLSTDWFETKDIGKSLKRI